MAKLCSAPFSLFSLQIYGNREENSRIVLANASSNVSAGVNF
jgi:hypothetical protein